jgi:nucleolar protein 9
MADNVFESSIEKEVAFCTHSVSSKIMEQLAPHTSPKVFETFTSALMPNLRVLVNDAFASFVLESCLKIATLRALSIKVETSDKAEKEEEEPANKKRKYHKVSSCINYNLNLEVKLKHKTYCQEFVVKVTRFMLNNLEDYISENNANHLIRSCILCLSAILSQKNHFNKIDFTNLKVEKGVAIPEDWSEIVGEFTERLMSWPQFPEMAFNESASVILQNLCQGLKNHESQSDMLKKLVKAIMKKSFKDEDETEDPEEFKAFSTTASVHLLESMMEACDEKLLNKIYKKFFKSKFMELCESSKLNFAVQRLVDAMRDKETFEEIFNIVSPEFAKLLQVGHTGVVLALCKSCERLGVKQGQFIQSMLKALECGAEKTGKCIMPILSLMPLSVVEEKPDSVDITLHGSLILQHIFQFNKPIKIVQSLLDMKPQDISGIFCDPKGSRIADAYLESKFIGEKSREKLIKHLDGMYLNMAASRSGAFVLEKFYKLSTDSYKEHIVKDLSERINQLTSSVSGRIICYKFSVEAYGRNVNQWRSYLHRVAATG